MLIKYNIPQEPFLEGSQAKGTRILSGDLADRYIAYQKMSMSYLSCQGFQPIILPSLDMMEVYTKKMGEEVENQMYTFKDKADRDLCLRPECTQTCSLLASSVFKTYPDLGLFYWQKCFRYERPQAGRYREFTQLGVEILNPKKTSMDFLIATAQTLLIGLGISPEKFELKQGVKRGLGIYNGDGFEIVAESLGAQKQICGGGPYENGIGFAIGIDRILLL